MHIDHADGRDAFVSELTLLLDTGGIRHLSAIRSAVMRAATRLPGTDLDRQGRVISTVGHLTVPAFG